MSKLTSEEAKRIGSKGGKACGYCKVRGASKYYKLLSKKAAKARAIIAKFKETKNES
jgi:hypothetical protein